MQIQILNSQQQVNFKIKPIHQPSTIHNRHMIKVPISDNYVMPSFQTVNKNPQQTQLILMDPQSTGLYLLHQYYCTDSQDYSDLIALLQTQATQGIQSPYVLNPVVYLPIKYTNQEFQTSHFVQVLYEYGSHTLQQELYLRIQEKNYFQEHQVWSILGSIVLGMKNLKDKQFTHSSVCMGDVFVTKEGQIKICHPMFRTYDHNNSQVVEQNYFQRAISENYYFAPEQLPTYMNKTHGKYFGQRHSPVSSVNQLNSQYHNQQYTHPQMTLEDIFKSDIFSTGMTIVSLCMLYPINDCYIKTPNNKSYQIDIDSERLSQYFSALEQMYSQDLLSLLFSMVAYNSEDRISIDQLATIIEQMILAKQLEEQQQLNQQGFQQHHQAQNNVMISKKYQQDAKGSVIRKNNNNLLNDNIMTSEQKFGKFSRVSQASPLSGRKTPRSTHTYGAPLQHNQPDPQDKPSIPSVQCQIDYPNVDIEDENSLNESQANIDYQWENNLQDQKIQSISRDSKQPEQESCTHRQNTQQSINQTLKQYINNQMSSILQVNQTKMMQENQRKLKQNKSTFSPQYVQSVMTSKELGSLPSDSTSFVVEKHVIGKDIGKENYLNFGNTLNHAKLIQSKEMQSQRKPINYQTLVNTNNKLTIKLQQNTDRQVKSRSPNSLKQFLNNIKQHNNQTPNNIHIIQQYPHQGITSARTFSEQTKQNNHIGANQFTLINAQLPTYNKMTSPSNKLQNPMKSSINISLNKQYENFMQMQKKNPSSLYTDPEFLKAIRQDVNKILNKRKLQLTSNGPFNPSTQSPLSNQFSPNQIYINGKKVDNPPKHQQINSFITPISYIARNTPYTNISQFR